MMKIGELINWPILLVSFFVGILFIIFKTGELRSIVVYPHPGNVNRMLYKDQSGTCFKYKMKDAECDSVNGSEIKEIPIQR